MPAPEDKSEIFDFLVEHGRPQRLTDIIEAVFEYGKASSRFPSVFEGLMGTLREDGRFQAVGKQTWTLPVLIPQEVLQVPESLLPETLDPTLLSDPEADAELRMKGWRITWRSGCMTHGMRTSVVSMKSNCPPSS